MSDFSTRVHLHYGRDFFNYYIRFGEPKYRDEYSGREAYEYFQKGVVFGYIRWKANEHGTQDWRFFVLRGGNKAAPLCKIPGVSPGAELLADIAGKERVHRFFKVIDQIEQAEIECSDVADWYWIQVSSRINTALNPLSYTPAQHRAWMLERKVAK